MKRTQCPLLIYNTKLTQGIIRIYYKNLPPTKLKILKEMGEFLIACDLRSYSGQNASF